MMPLYSISKTDLFEIGRNDISAADIGKIQDRVLSSKFDLADSPTCDLVNELAKREGVTEIVCPDSGHNYDVDIRDSEDRPMEQGICGKRGNGPARILVVID